jgi:hypothetical protein
MLAVYENVINTIKNDSIIQSFVSDRVYPEGVDINPEVLPMVTVHHISEIVHTVPRNDRMIQMQVSIWSKLSELEVEQIAERVEDLLNFQTFDTGYGSAIQRWQRMDTGADLFESDRRIWHKALTFRIWARP